MSGNKLNHAIIVEALMELPGPELPVSIAFDYEKKLWSECKTADRNSHGRSWSQRMLTISRYIDNQLAC